MLKVYIARIVLRLFYIFPINRKKVFFSSYEGGPITCNPKYIYQELKKRYGNELIYIWVWNKLPEEQPGSENVIFVKHNSLRYIFHIMTSKFMFSNTGISVVFPIRKKQIVVNTWHGAGCYKKVGKDVSDAVNGGDGRRRKYTERNTTYFISGCREFTRVLSNAIDLNEKKFIPIGMPRNDILINSINSEQKENIRAKIEIPNKKILLYAPTYRGARENPAEAACPLDVEAVLKALSEKFGDEWVFAYRCHYSTASQFKQIENAVDLSWYDDMQELLAVSDVLISDYSSSIWDYSFTGKPCFLYCYDLKEYTEERDFYIPIRDWRFPVSENTEKLIEQIQLFSPDEFIENMKLHHQELGSYESGTAAKQMVDLVENEIS